MAGNFSCLIATEGLLKVTSVVYTVNVMTETVKLETMLLQTISLIDSDIWPIG